jgi:putative transposase
VPGTRGRPPVPFRKVLDVIMCVLRTGCQWKALPREYGSGSTCHRTFQPWVGEGVFQRIRVKLLQRYDGAHGIKWRWQSLDSSSVKAPLGGEDWSRPPDRGKLGTKRQIMTERKGTTRP